MYLYLIQIADTKKKDLFRVNRDFHDEILTNDNSISFAIYLIVNMALYFVLVHS